MDKLSGLSSTEKRALLESLLARKARKAQRRALSHGQRSLWFVHRLAPESSAYNMAFAYRCRAELDLDKLRSAFQRLIDRHAILRTSYPMQDGEPVQFVKANAEVDFQVIPVRGYAAEALHDRIRDAAKQPFDLENGPVLRICVFECADNDYIQLVAMHHIASDMWSCEQFMAELRATYVAELRGATADLPALHADYSDFVDWQLSMLAGPEGAAHLAYWKDRLAGQLQPLDLPTDRPRPRVQTFAGASFLFDFDAELIADARRLASKAGVTLYVVFLSVFFVLLQRYSRQSDLLVGAPTLGRPKAEFEGLLGYFVNPVVFRADTGGDPTFGDFVARVRKTVIEALDHQDYPFPLLVEKLNVTRDPSRSPLTDVFFVWDRTREDRNEVTVRKDGDSHRTISVDWGGVELESFHLSQVGTPSDLVLLILEHGDSVAGHLAYNTDLFDAETIAAMSRQFRELLRSAVSAPETALSRLSMMNARERAALLDMGAARSSFKPAAPTLHAAFEARASAEPDRPAVRDAGSALSYGELNARANRLAHRLLALGVAAGDRVGLSVGRTTDIVVGILGILKAGAAYVPLDPAYPTERLEYVANDSQVRAVVVAGDVQSSRAAHVLVRLDDPGPDDGSATNPVTAGSGKDCAYVIYTSGSTGRPKGVMVSHANVLRLFESSRHWFEFSSQDVWSVFHSSSFDFSVWEIWGALLHGGSAVVVPYETSRSPDAFLEFLQAESISMLSQTPSAFRQLCWAISRLPAPPPLALRWVVFGGEALEFGGLRQWFGWYGDEQPRLANMYGITETTVHVTFRAVHAAEAIDGAPSLIGEPLPDLSLHVLDEAGEPLPAGVPGELYVGGEGVAIGYLGRPELTAQRFIPDPFATVAERRLYRSGDLARRRTDGDIEYLGRIDNQIQIRGFRVELGEVEAALSSFPGVRRAVVMARSVAADDLRLQAYVVFDSDAAAGARQEALLAHVRRQLPDYMVPASILEIDSVPLTENGKVDFVALGLLGSGAGVTRGEFAEPGTETERKIASIWQDLLGVQRVGATDNFFDLGGHSLLGTRVASRFADEFGVELPLRDFFEMPTVEALAARIDALLVLGGQVAGRDDKAREEFEL